MLDIVWAFMKGLKNILIPVAAGVVGFIIGLVIFGWWLTPVAYVDAGPQDLREADYQQFYLRSLATTYALDPNSEPFVKAAVRGWETAPQAVCQAVTIARQGTEFLPQDEIAAQRLEQLASLYEPGGCAAIEAGVAAEGEAGSNWLATCGYGLLLLLLLGVGVLLWQRRMSTGEVDMSAFDRPKTKPEDIPTEGPISGDDEGEQSNVTAIASYRTTYEQGMNNYDDSFSIETADGDFMGECGVGISESIGSGEDKNVTAIEVWLFDKNDIRTITKVAMSDHAFFDDAIKAKLAPKGEPVLARQDEVVVLETASLIINARITEVEYGDKPDLPEKSFFARLGVELSAWSKDDAPDSGNTVSSVSFDDVL